MLINRENHELRLFDWGYAEFYFPGKKYEEHGKQKSRTKPESLIGYSQIDYSYDIWDSGRLFANMLFNKQVVDFNKVNDKYNFDEIWDFMTTVFGSQAWIDYNEKYGANNEKLAELVGDRPKPKNPW